MDLDRSHFRATSTGNSSTTTAATATSELFICFTSRLSSSSSSMKLTKSILSPGRAARDGLPVSLSSSLSRRLRSNGSLKGGQASPFFNTPGEKRGCGFENPEPSSPKVTCIGQVRVRTKKKMEQTRSLSRRRSGEGSFRRPEPAADGGHQSEGKICAQNSNVSAYYQQQQQSQECLPHRNQRWVHLPISVCETIRAIGAEFSCLLPCKSSCFSTSEREKAEKQNGSTASEKGQSSCGAVFARWLVSVNDGEGGKRREIELVVGGGDEEQMAERMSMRSSRRHVFEDIEVNDDRIEVKGQSVEGDDETARVSICIPPKNALLLMRCRSDPMKMAALANRFIWDAQAAPKDEDIEEESNGEVNEDLEEKVRAQECEGSEGEVFMVKEVEVDEVIKENGEQEIGPDSAQASLEMEVGDHGIGEENQEGELLISSEEMLKEKEQEELQQEIEANDDALVEEVEVESNMSLFDALLDQEIAERYEGGPIQHKEEIDEIPLCFLSPSAKPDEEQSERIEVPPFHEDAEKDKEEPITAEEETTFEDNDEENQVSSQQKSEAEIPEKTHQEYDKEDKKTVAELTKSETEEPENQEPKKVKEGTVLPECLLLMMCEPKLSMEVSKETWVCSTDFIRFLPERPLKVTAKATKGGGCIHEEPTKRMLRIDSKPKPISHALTTENNQQQHPHLQQPPRSSCSLPAAASSMATMIEHKLVSAVAYEPFVLTRCKSEPMKTAAAKLMPESCFWNNAMRKLEPHRQATVGVGAAGVGF